MTNTELLKEIINEKGIKKKRIIEELGMGYNSFQKKLNNLKPFNAIEIEKLCNLLDINSLKLKERVFFATDVDKMSTKISE